MKPYWPSKPDSLGACRPVQDPQATEPGMGPELPLLWERLCRVLVLWVTRLGMWGLTSPPFPRILLGVLLHIFCGNRSSRAGSSLFIGGGSCDAGVLLGVSSGLSALPCWLDSSTPVNK